VKVASLVAACGVALGSTVAACGSVLGLDDIPYSPVATDGPADAGGTGDAGPGCNGDPSCAGASCNAQGFGCVPAPLAGWSGPVLLFESTAAGVVRPPCTLPSPIARVEGSAGLQAVAPSCTCGCTPNGCPPLVLRGYSDSFCAAGTACNGAAPVVVPTGTCASTSALFNGCSLGMGIGILDGGRLPSDGCTVGASAPVPPIQWGTIARGCGAATDAVQGGCPVGRVCTAQPRVPFESGVCVFQAGDNSCASAGVYSVHRLYYSEVMDTRACTACTCSIPAASRLCATTGQAFGAPDCNSMGGTSVNPSATCGSVSDVNQAYIKFPAATQCDVQPGSATGAATAKSPVTVCCLP
jgi:hypothetical protein